MDISWLKCTCGAGKICPLCMMLTIALFVFFGLIIVAYIRKKRNGPK